jgi:hypothetical protein
MFTPDDLFGDDDIIWYLMHEHRAGAADSDEDLVEGMTLTDWLLRNGYDPENVDSWNVPEVLAIVPWDLLDDDHGFRPDWA